MGRQEGAEGLDGVLAVAGDGEDHRLLLALHVEEHSDVALAASGCGFIDADGGHIAQIQFPQHAADVVVHDAPQPLVGDLQLPGDGQYRHFLDQRHGGLLEQQGEVAAWPGPGHLDALDAMLRALGAGHAGVQVAVMLEEVQMPPGLVGEVVSRTGLTALRAGVEAAALGLDVEVQPVGRYGGIQVLVLEDPGRFQAQAEGQNLGAVHAMPPVVVEVISWPSSGGEFHTQRRRAYNTDLLTDTNLEGILIWILKSDFDKDWYRVEKTYLTQAIDNVGYVTRRFFSLRNNADNLKQAIRGLRHEVYEKGSDRELLFVDIISSILLRKIENSSINCLPKYTKIPIKQ